MRPRRNLIAVIGGMEVVDVQAPANENLQADMRRKLLWSRTASSQKQYLPQYAFSCSSCKDYGSSGSACAVATHIEIYPKIITIFQSTVIGRRTYMTQGEYGITTGLLACQTCAVLGADVCLGLRALACAYGRISGRAFGTALRAFGTGLHSSFVASASLHTSWYALVDLSWCLSANSS